MAGIVADIAGSFLAVPTGIYNRSSGSSAPGYTTYIYARAHWEAPVSGVDRQLLAMCLWLPLYALSLWS